MDVFQVESVVITISQTLNCVN